MQRGWNYVVHWRELGEVENECASHNLSHFAILVSCSANNEMFPYGLVCICLNLWICKLLDIHLMWTLLSGAHSNNLKQLMKTRNPSNYAFFKKPGFNPETKTQWNPSGWAFKKIRFFSALMNVLIVLKLLTHCTYLDITVETHSKIVIKE